MSPAGVERFVVVSARFVVWISTGVVDEDSVAKHGDISTFVLIVQYSVCYGRSQWPRGLRRGSAAARLLRLRVGIPPGAWMFVCCECCVMSGRGLCDE